MTSLEESQTALTKAQSQIELLQNSLDESKKESIQLQATLQEQVTTLAVLKINSDLQSKSYEQLKKRVDLIWLDRLAFGVVGLGAGFGVNEIYNRLK